MRANNDNAADLLYGASAIANYLNVSRAIVYHMVADATIPTFKLGKTVCARMATLDKWLADQEARAAA